MLLSLVTLSLFRLFYAFKIVDAADFSNAKFDILKALAVGVRFDLMVTCYLMILPLLLLLSAAITTKIIFEQAARVLVLILLLLTVFLAVIDYFYFNYFQSHINALAFGLMDDDTQLVLLSVYHDYPVFRVLVFLLLSFFVLRALLKKNIYFS